MKLVALKNLVEGDRNYLPGDEIKQVGQLFEHREYYARIGCLRIEDSNRPVAIAKEVISNTLDIPPDAINKAKEAAQAILGGTKKGRPKKEDSKTELEEEEDSGLSDPE